MGCGASSEADASAAALTSVVPEPAQPEPVARIEAEPDLDPEPEVDPLDLRPAEWLATFVPIDAAREEFEPVLQHFAALGVASMRDTADTKTEAITALRAALPREARQKCDTALGELSVRLSELGLRDGLGNRLPVWQDLHAHTAAVEEAERRQQREQLEMQEREQELARHAETTRSTASVVRSMAKHLRYNLHISEYQASQVSAHIVGVAAPSAEQLSRLRNGEFWLVLSEFAPLLNSAQVKLAPDAGGREAAGPGITEYEALAQAVLATVLWEQALPDELASGAASVIVDSAWQPTPSGLRASLPSSTVLGGLPDKTDVLRLAEAWASEMESFTRRHWEEHTVSRRLTSFVRDHYTRQALDGMTDGDTQSLRQRTQRVISKYTFPREHLKLLIGGELSTLLQQLLQQQEGARGSPAAGRRGARDAAARTALDGAEIAQAMNVLVPTQPVPNSEPADGRTRLPPLGGSQEAARPSAPRSFVGSSPSPSSVDSSGDEDEDEQGPSDQAVRRNLLASLGPPKPAVSSLNTEIESFLKQNEELSLRKADNRRQLEKDIEALKQECKSCRDDEVFLQKLSKSGAQRGDVTCSLRWDSHDDLDLHCKTPSGAHIYFGNMKAGGGWLDIDDRGNGNLVENIFFDTPAPGQYVFWIKRYSPYNGPIPFRVALEVSGQVDRKEFTFTRTSDRIDAFKIDYTVPSAEARIDPDENEANRLTQINALRAKRAMDENQLQDAELTVCLRLSEPSDVRDIAAIVNKYPDALICVDCHADTGDRGDDLRKEAQSGVDHKQLTTTRAKRVSSALAEHGVDIARLCTYGSGNDPRNPLTNTMMPPGQNNRCYIYAVDRETFDSLQNDYGCFAIEQTITSKLSLPEAIAGQFVPSDEQKKRISNAKDSGNEAMKVIGELAKKADETTKEEVAKGCVTNALCEKYEISPGTAAWTAEATDAFDSTSALCTKSVSLKTIHVLSAIFPLSYHLCPLSSLNPCADSTAWLLLPTENAVIESLGKPKAFEEVLEAEPSAQKIEEKLLTEKLALQSTLTHKIAAVAKLSGKSVMKSLQNVDRLTDVMSEELRDKPGPLADVAKLLLEDEKDKRAVEVLVAGGRLTAIDVMGCLKKFSCKPSMLAQRIAEFPIRILRDTLGLPAELATSLKEVFDLQPPQLLQCCSSADPSQHVKEVLKLMGQCSWPQTCTTRPMVTPHKCKDDGCQSCRTVLSIQSALCDYVTHAVRQFCTRSDLHGSAIESVRSYRIQRHHVAMLLQGELVALVRIVLQDCDPGALQCVLAALSVMAADIIAEVLQDVLRVEAVDAEHVAKALSLSTAQVQQITRGGDDTLSVLEQLAPTILDSNACQILAQAAVAIALSDKAGLKSEFADRIATSISLNPSKVNECISDPLAVLRVLGAWVQASPTRAADALAEPVKQCLIQMVDEHTSMSDSARSSAVSAIEQFQLQGEHCSLLLEGDLGRLATLVLQGKAVDALNSIAPGLEKHVAKGMDGIIKVDGMGEMISGSLDVVGDDLMGGLVEVLECIPVAEPVVKLMRKFYLAAKGAKVDQANCLVFAQQVKRAESLLQKANQTQMVDEPESAIAEMKAVIMEALQYVEQLGNTGYFRRVLSTNHNARRLEELSVRLRDTVQYLSAEATFNIGTAPANQSFIEDPTVAKLRVRVENMGGLDALDLNDGDAMDRLAEGLPLDRQIFRSEMALGLQEIIGQQAEILKILEDGEWRIIETKEAQAFWMTRMGDSVDPMEADFLVDMLENFMMNPPLKIQLDLSGVTVPLDSNVKGALARLLASTDADDDDNPGKVTIEKMAEHFCREGGLGATIVELLIHQDLWWSLTNDSEHMTASQAVEKLERFLIHPPSCISVQPGRLPLPIDTLSRRVLELHFGDANGMISKDQMIEALSGSGADVCQRLVDILIEEEPDWEHDHPEPDGAADLEEEDEFDAYDHKSLVPAVVARKMRISASESEHVAKALSLSTAQVQQITRGGDDTLSVLEQLAPTILDSNACQILAQAAVAIALSDKAGLKSEFADRIATSISLNPSKVNECISDPLAVLRVLGAWVQASPTRAADALAEPVKQCLIQMVDEHTSMSDSARSSAVSAIEQFQLQGEHCSLLLEGDLGRLATLVLQGKAVDALNSIAPGLEKHVAKGMDGIIKVDGMGEMISGSLDVVGDDLMGGLVEVLECIPVAEPVVKLMRKFYLAAKGANVSHQQCVLFSKQLQQAERMLGKANMTSLGGEPVLTELHNTITEAVAFVETLQGKGYLKRLLAAKRTDSKLEQLSRQLADQIQTLQTFLILNMAAPPDSELYLKDEQNAEVLRERVRAKGGLKNIDPEDKAEMDDLTRGLPFDQRMMRRELLFLQAEIKQNNANILSTLAEGPWNVIRNIELRSFWYEQLRGKGAIARRNMLISKLETYIHHHRADQLDNRRAPDAVLVELGSLAKSWVEPKKATGMGHLKPEDKELLGEVLDTDNDEAITVLEIDNAFDSVHRRMCEQIADLIDSVEERKYTGRPAKLPPQSSRFAGRMRELEIIERGIQKHMDLVCVCAPPGSGKTALLVEAGWRADAHFKELHEDDDSEPIVAVTYIDIAGYNRSVDISRAILGPKGLGTDESELSTALAPADDAAAHLLLLDNAGAHSEVAAVLKQLRICRDVRVVLSVPSESLPPQVASQFLFTRVSLEPLSSGEGSEVLAAIAPTADRRFVDSLPLGSLLPIHITTLKPLVEEAFTINRQQQVKAEIARRSKVLREETAAKKNHRTAHVEASSSSSSQAADGTVPAHGTKSAFDKQFIFTTDKRLQDGLLKLSLAIPAGSTFDAETADTIISKDEPAKPSIATRIGKYAKIKGEIVDTLLIDNDAMPLGINFSAVMDQATGYKALMVSSLTEAGFAHTAGSTIDHGMLLYYLNETELAGESLATVQKLLRDKRPLLLGFISHQEGSGSSLRAVGAVNRASAYTRGNELIWQLARANVIEEPSQGRYRVVSSIATALRKQAEDKLSEKHVDEVRCRHTKHCIGKLKAVTTMIASGQNPAGMRAFDSDDQQHAQVFAQNPIPRAVIADHVGLGAADPMPMYRLLCSRMDVTEVASYYQRLRVAVKAHGADALAATQRSKGEEGGVAEGDPAAGLSEEVDDDNFKLTATVLFAVTKLRSRAAARKKAALLEADAVGGRKALIPVRIAHADPHRLSSADFNTFLQMTMAVSAGHAAYGLPPAPIKATLNELTPQLGLSQAEERAFASFRRFLEINEREHGEEGSKAFLNGLAKMAGLSDRARAAALAGAAAMHAHVVPPPPAGSGSRMSSGGGGERSPRSPRSPSSSPRSLSPRSPAREMKVDRP